MRSENSGSGTPRKHHQVYSSLSRDIHSGRWKRGERLPSEAQLVESFRVSRITIGRAVRDLQAAGLVERRAGSGTFVKAAHGAGGCSFGLLIPNREETGIFEPIWEGMMASPRARGHALVWGSASAHRPKEERAWELCVQYIERKVSGVFFAPLELTPFKDECNRRIVRALDESRIPVVLLDRPLVPYPQTGRHDLIGIDNRRAGHVITEHLLRLGCRRVLFVGPKDAASTVDEREAGYREALHAAGVQFDRALTYRMDADDIESVRAVMQSGHPDGIACANDRTAGHLMHALLQLKYRIPDDVRLVGVDDVDYASLLPVPLTTLRQPTREIGEAALAVMLERIARRDMVPREVRLSCELVVRESSGARPASGR